jgi:integrase/recombinase XerD
MLSVYTRHSEKCQHRDDIAWRRCRCPKWIQGTPSEDHEFLRTSAQTRTWEQAEEKARKLEEAARPGARKTAPAITIAEAVAAYRADETARCLSKSTTNQSKTLFQFHLLAWVKDVGLSLLRELTTPNLVKFRATWGNGPNTTRRKHERLIGFFEFCIANDWLDKNPALKMKKAEEKRVPTDYFTREEFQRIVDATYAYGDWRGGRDFHYRPERMRALILLMRWSGLAIRDAVALERDKLSADGKLFLYRAKTGVPVRVPLPTDLAQLLRSLPSTNPNCFFWSGNGDPETAKKGWQRALRRLFKRAKIKKPDGTPKRCHPHMFRDTFAVELLLSGVPIDQVSLLLGHSSVKVTEKHYAPFVKARQEQLENSVKLSWQVHREWLNKNPTPTPLVN